MSDILGQHREIWKKKPLLRHIYTDWYRLICENLKKGKTLEVGSGTGNFKEYKPDIISSDIDKQPWLDLVCDAHKIPMKNSSLGNIVMIDVLHHLNEPLKFFDEAYRVLKPGGRIVMLEPYPSKISLFVYRLVHPEPFIFETDYKSLRKNNKSKQPWDSNQAIPYLLFTKYRDQFENEFESKFKILKIDKLTFFLYPLSGGFGAKQFIPNPLVGMGEKIEKKLSIFKEVLAFRCFIVIEKK